MSMLRTRKLPTKRDNLGVVKRKDENGGHGWRCTKSGGEVKGGSFAAMGPNHTGAECGKGPKTIRRRSQGAYEEAGAVAGKKEEKNLVLSFRESGAYSKEKDAGQ